MKLIPISQRTDAAKNLWDLLEERPPEACISHKQMPTWGEHLDFILSKPYRAWYLIQNALGIVGAIYLTKQDEIGVSIFREFQSHGFAPEAIVLLMAEHDDRPRFLANVAPNNEPSRKMFEKLGFKLVQHTYALEAE